MNKVLLKGNVTKELTLEKVGSKQVSKCRFVLAVDRLFSGGTDFIPITVWNGLAESCVSTLTRGDTIEVDGRIESRSWDDKKEPDKKRYAQDVIADTVKKIERNKAAGQTASVVVVTGHSDSGERAGIEG